MLLYSTDAGTMFRSSKSLRSKNWGSNRRFNQPCHPTWIVITVILGTMMVMISLLLLMVVVLQVHSASFHTDGLALLKSSNANADVTNLMSLSLSPIQNLPNEEEFQKTIQECINDHDIVISSSDKEKDKKRSHKKCKEYLPDETNPDLQRIGFLSTGGTTSQKMYEIIKRALLVYHDNDEQAMRHHIDFQWMTHVPALGYGKSHGWTKIVRVLHSPLIQETLEALSEEMDSRHGDNLFSSSLSLQSSHHDTSHGSQHQDETRLSKGMRQVIRFHCRLSHVAAHTAVYNLDLSSSSLLEDVMRIVERLVAHPRRPSLSSTDGRDLEHLDSRDPMARVKSYLREALSGDHIVWNQDTITESSSTSLTTQEDIMEELQHTLQDELDSTNGLKKWPCKSFWDVKGIDTDETLRQMASKLSPDCNAPFTKCMVQRDWCEMNGKVKCS